MLTAVRSATRKRGRTSATELFGEERWQHQAAKSVQHARDPHGESDHEFQPDGEADGSQRDTHACGHRHGRVKGQQEYLPMPRTERHDCPRGAYSEDPHTASA